MCGIGGFRRFGSAQIDADQIDILFCALQKRGTDASGIACVNEDGQLYVLRDDTPAYQFVNTPEYKKFIKEHLNPGTVSVIIHTRAATTGDPRVEQNNHPMFFDKTAVIHNGMIHNDDSLFTELKYTRHAETDSDILRAITDNEGLTKKAVRTISRCNGSVALAALTPEDPFKLLLVRSGSPLVLAEIGDMLVFASEKQMIHKAVRPWETKFNVEFQRQRLDIGFHGVPDNSAYIFGKNGLEWHDKCQTCTYYTEPVRSVWYKSETRKKRWTAADEDKSPKVQPVVGSGGSSDTVDNRFRHRCPSCKQFNRFELSHQNKQLYELGCGFCHERMAPKPSESETEAMSC